MGRTSPFFFAGLLIKLGSVSCYFQSGSPAGMVLWYFSDMRLCGAIYEARMEYFVNIFVF